MMNISRIFSEKKNDHCSGTAAKPPSFLLLEMKEVYMDG